MRLERDRLVVELTHKTKAAMQAEATRRGTSLAFIIRGLCDEWLAAVDWERKLSLKKQRKRRSGTRP